MNIFRRFQQCCRVHRHRTTKYSPDAQTCFCDVKASSGTPVLESSKYQHSLLNANAGRDEYPEQMQRSTYKRKKKEKGSTRTISIQPKKPAEITVTCRWIVYVSLSYQIRVSVTFFSSWNTYLSITLKSAEALPNYCRQLLSWCPRNF